jgi:hypothetical protein
MRSDGSTQESGKNLPDSKRQKTERQRKEKQQQNLDDPSLLSKVVKTYKDVEQAIAEGKGPTDKDLDDLYVQALGRTHVEGQSRLTVVQMIKMYMGKYNTDKDAWSATGVKMGTFKDLKPDFKAFIDIWTRAFESGKISVQPPRPRPRARAPQILAEVDKVQQPACSGPNVGPSAAAHAPTAQAEQPRALDARTGVEPSSLPNDVTEFLDCSDVDSLYGMLSSGDGATEAAFELAAGAVTFSASPAQAHPGASSSAPALHSTPSPSATPTDLPLDGSAARCRLPGCDKPCHLKNAATGELHDYCRWSHVTWHRLALYKEQVGLDTIPDADALKCAQPYCRNKRFGRHEYCSKACAAVALLAMTALRSSRASSSWLTEI